jgi:hypothetical protein
VLVSGVREQAAIQRRAAAARAIRWSAREIIQVVLRRPGGTRQRAREDLLELI